MEIFFNISDNCLVIELFQINRVFLPWDHVIIWLISKVRYFYGLQFCIQNIQTKWLGSQFTTLTWPWRIFNDFTIKIKFSLNVHRPIIWVTNMTVTKTNAVDCLVSCVAIAHLCHITNKSVNYVQICVSP